MLLNAFTQCRNFVAMTQAVVGGRKRWRSEEVQRGRVGGGVFRGGVSRSASTVFSGGGRGDERQTRRHPFFWAHY